MPFMEIPFESLSLALESTRGTAVTPPTHRLNMAGTLTPVQEKYHPPDELGTLEEFYRSETVRQSGKWAAEGAADPTKLPLLLNMIAKPLTAGVQQGATAAYLWAFVPTITSDDLKSATLYWGDPNVRMWQGAHGMLDSLSIGGDASGTDSTMLSVEGTTRFPADIAAPTLPAIAVGPLITPSKMLVWIDSAEVIGTTAVTGRVVSAEHTLVSGITYKYVATGPAGGITFDHIGRMKRHMETKLVLEVPDMTQYDQWEASTVLKVRVRHNGPLIETPHYYHIEVDTYGPFSGFDWGEHEGTNRTVELTILSEYNATLGASWRIAVMNAQAGL